MNCVAILPNDTVCGRSMKVHRSERVPSGKEAYVFRCLYCGAVRVVTD